MHDHNITSPNIAHCAMTGEQYERQAKPALLLAKLVAEIPLTYLFTISSHFLDFKKVTHCNLMIQQLKY